ncbi:MAG TPA: 8-amino-7-oxononanoate synthase [Dissulfurispiraceae bacterium]|nr:8-amino-7-oxononanoate synthase [Dissulfurispiraceae bacterium]
MFADELIRLREKHLFRSIRDREPCQNGAGLARIVTGGTTYINFSSNDYLGLGASPAVCNSARKAIDLFGFGSGASRLLSGGTSLHRDLERLIARLKGTKSAVVMNSGYTANLAVIPAVAREGDVIFSDELNHASIVDGCRLSRARTLIYRHRDAAHLAELLEREKSGRKIVVTDTVFSMDGDIAPLADLYGLCRDYDAVLYIDDAHGTGVLGKGRGGLAHCGLAPDDGVIQMGTCSKALGSCGAFVAATADVIDWLINTARGLIFSTALPACAAAASIAALQVMQGDGSYVDRLWRNRERLYQGIRALGIDTGRSETPIIPLIVGDLDRTMRLSEHLRHHRLYAPVIRPPTVRTPRIRVTVTAAHTDEDIDTFLNVLAKGL